MINNFHFYLRRHYKIIMHFMYKYDNHHMNKLSKNCETKNKAKK